MRLILALIQPTKLKAVQEALAKIGVDRMTVCDAHGYGRQKGQAATYRGAEYKTNLLRKVALEIAVNDAFVDATIEAIVHASRTEQTGKIGDGKIFVSNVDEVIRIRTSERGEDAIS